MPLRSTRKGGKEPSASAGNNKKTVSGTGKPFAVLSRMPAIEADPGSGGGGKGTGEIAKLGSVRDPTGEYSGEAVTLFTSLQAGALKVRIMERKIIALILKPTRSGALSMPPTLCYQLDPKASRRITAETHCVPCSDPRSAAKDSRS